MTMNGRRILAWALAIVPAVAAVAAGAQPGGEIRFGNSKIELRFDKITGRWLSLHDPADGAALMDDGGLSSVLLTTDGRTTVTTGRDHIWSLQDEYTVGAGVKLTGSREQQEGDKRRLILQTEEGNWRIIQKYEMASGGDTVERHTIIILRPRSNEAYR